MSNRDGHISLLQARCPSSAAPKRLLIMSAIWGKTSTTVFAVAVAAVLFTSASMVVAAQLPAYTNHTVGGAAGWFFNETKNSSVANYNTWAATQSFYLGDFLIFHTNSNTTVVQTYNQTTYHLCDASGDDDVLIFTPKGNTEFGVAAVVEVPLTVEGTNYFFSDAGADGIQCAKGMRFHIKVGHGRGLSPQLNQPPPPPSVDSQVPPPPAEASTVPEGNPQEQQFYRGGARSDDAIAFWGPIAAAWAVGVAFIVESM
ncbi:hypothetical protein HPP92_023385 [Vanilla planifolia]|uniref:Phytocyanin domain-containing protein n=1 Tax=Vanilla planifolia TaxID=51239 RepID=A0A835UEF0_VANPL|nr:hypothetical protein HPP92_023385 [Vanilla planifolia]